MRPSHPFGQAWRGALSFLATTSIQERAILASWALFGGFAFLFFVWPGPDHLNRDDLTMEFVGVQSGRACLVPQDEERRTDDALVDWRFCYQPSPGFTAAKVRIGDCVKVWVPLPAKEPDYSVQYIKTYTRPCAIPPEVIEAAKQKFGL